MQEVFKYFWRVAPCLMAIIVDYMGYGLVYPIITEMFVEKSVVFYHLGSSEQINFYLGLAYLLYPFGMFFGASFLGDLSDNLGRKKVILIAVAGILISFLIMGVGIWKHMLWLFLLGRLFSGLMAGSQPLSQAAIADLSDEKTKPWNMALITLTNCIGLVFGPLVAGIFSEPFFIKEYGFIPPFIVASIISALTFLWILIKFKETYQVKKRVKIDWTRPLFIFIDAFKNKQVWVLSTVLLLFQLAVAIYYQNSAVTLTRKFHDSTSEVGFFYGFLGLSFIFSTLIVYPFFLKRFDSNRIVLIGLFGMALFEILLSFIDIQWLFWLCIFVMANFNILAWTPLLTIFSGITDQSKQGWIMGIFAANIAVAFVISGFTSNLLNIMSSQQVIFIGGVIGILSGFFMLYFHLKKSHFNQQ